MGTRDIPAAIETNLGEDVVRPFFAVELLFDSAPLRLWTGYNDLDIDGVTYTGSGNVMSISSVEETTDLSVKGATIVLSGVPAEVISAALSTPYQGRVCNIYFGTFPLSDPVLESQLTEIFSGYMDEMNIEETPDTSTVEVKVENKLIDLERARTRRYSSGYQKTVFPNDIGFDFVESLQDKKITWGRKGFE